MQAKVVVKIARMMQMFLLSFEIETDIRISNLGEVLLKITELPFNL